METILVTGGLGFQGIHLTKRLLGEGHQVFVLNTPSEHAQGNLKWLKEQTDTTNLTVVWGSIIEDGIFERVIPQCSTVFHLAAKINVDESIERPNVFYETNVKGTYNILNWAEKTGARVILASTCEVYGGGEDIDENSILNPKSPYAASKTAAERIAYSYTHTYGLNIDIVRPFNVYGPRQKNQGKGAVIPIFFRMAMNDETVSIHGNGKQGRDFIYIDDVINGYMKIFNSPSDGCRVFTFGTGVSTTVIDLVKKIDKILKEDNKSINYQFVEGRKGQVDTFISKRALFHYFDSEEKITSIDEGLAKYYESIK